MLHTPTRTRGLPVALGAMLFAIIVTGLAAAVRLGLMDGVPTPVALLCTVAAPPAALAGAALVPAALAVMAPCLLQLSAALVAAAAGLAASETPRALRRAGLAFAAGFLGVYAPVALLVGLAGQALASWAGLLQAAGGVMLALLGLAALRVLPRAALAGCRGPRWLILTGRASLRRPLAAGGAFAVYCLGCCGPYLAGLALLGAGAGSPAAAAGLILGFALLMGALLLLPVFALGASRRLRDTLARHGGRIAPIAGASLVALGLALALQPLLPLAR